MDATAIADIITNLGLDAGIFMMLYILIQKFIDKMDDKLDKLVEAVNEIKGMLSMNGRGEGDEEDDC